MESDLIVDIITIDGGWIFGRVKRTGQSGLIPFNYLESGHKVNISKI